MHVKIRKDSWTTEEDNLLKELVLKKMEEGHTQLSGFHEASILLGRSKQACAFRWNKNLRPAVRQKEVPKKEVTDSSSLQNHLQLAMATFDEMKQSYDEISNAYNLLKTDYEQLINWVKQGITHVEKK
ncbi:transcriptional regulator [Psychrobacillus sp.]|uniref:transcriptional regulator n=1 Tax=Psychrobacillus sp. TaxID=1871623 RepID=UPI0028BD1E26|nr:transcriptional regulator [Psychrobacillus sp.]